MPRLAPLVAAAFAAALAPAQTITIPNGTATVEGSSNNAFPWGRGGLGLLHQAIYDSSNFTAQGVTAPIAITRLKWRPDSGTGRTWSTCSYQPATIKLSTCPLDQGSASLTFANNRGADLTTVFSGLVTYAAGTSTPPGPAPFLVDVTLTTPFVYDPALGDLNIETDLPVGSFTGSGALQFDVQSTGAQSCRVYASSTYGAATGLRDLNHGCVVEVSFAPAAGYATAIPYGDGCVRQHASFYESFPSAAAFDLANSSMTMIHTGAGYISLLGVTAFVPPTAGATVLTLADNSETTVTLAGAMPFPGGTTTTLTVCSNGFVSVASGNGTAAAPSVTALLNGPRTGWWNHHDFNPALAGSGQVKFEQVGGIAYVTWDGVFDAGGTSAANASTMQFQFELATGNVHRVWGATSTLGGTGFVIGYSPGGPSSDPGSIDLSTALAAALVTPAADVAPLGLSGATRPIGGTNCDLLTANIPTGSLFGAVLVGATRWSPGLDLTSIGMPGCRQYGDGLATFLFVLPGVSNNTLLAIPTGYSGTHLFAQSVVYCPSAGLTPLGALASNGLDLGLGTQ